MELDDSIERLGLSRTNRVVEALSTTTRRRLDHRGRPEHPLGFGLASVYRRQQANLKWIAENDPLLLMHYCASHVREEIWEDTDQVGGDMQRRVGAWRRRPPLRGWVGLVCAGALVELITSAVDLGSP